MKRCHESNVQSMGPNQQQYKQQNLRTAAEEQRCPLLPQTTPVWGDGNVVSNRATPLQLSFISLFLTFSSQYAYFIHSLDPSPFIFNKMSACKYDGSRIDIESLKLKRGIFFSYLHLLRYLLLLSH